MSEIQHNFVALKRSTYSRLLSINKTIRENRKTFDKETLNYYKGKRKETDQLLSKINCVSKNDNDTYLKLKESYMTFDIK